MRSFFVKYKYRSLQIQRSQPTLHRTSTSAHPVGRTILRFLGAQQVVTRLDTLLLIAAQHEVGIIKLAFFINVLTEGCFPNEFNLGVTPPFLILFTDGVATSG